MEMSSTYQTSTHTTTTHATLRCQDCKATGRRTYQMHYTTTAYDGRMLTSQSMEINGRARNVKGRYDVKRNLHMPCPKCGSTRVHVNLIKGTYIAEKECDARCMSAKGGDCECSCGGENHGAAHRIWR